MKHLLKTSGADQPRDWRLPILACKAVGGDLEQAIPAAAAIACLQISIVLVDDLLDSDPRGVHQRLGTAATANLAIAFQACGLNAIVRSRAKLSIQYAAMSTLNRMMFMTAHGQYLDAGNPRSEEAYWQLVRRKSSPFFGAALHVGALLGGASAERAAQLEHFGCLYGEMIQIHDDLNDAMAVPANPDWTQGRASLPILFAELVDHADRNRFLDMQRAIPNPGALNEAQRILIRCGAVSYCIDQLLQRHREARRLQEQLGLPHAEELDSLLNALIEPVGKLMAAAGIPCSAPPSRPADAAQ